MDTSTRQRWLGALANSPMERLQALLPPALPAAPRWLRRAETGLMMLQGRSGGSGARFNLGEISVSRASCEIDGHIGHGWVRGGDGRRHAERRQEDRQLLARRVAGAAGAQPHIDPGGDQP